MESKLWFEEYDDYVNESVQYKDPTYAALGLAGECGEVVEVIKKLYREHNQDWDNHIISKVSLLDDILYELGDVLWYTARLANLLGSSLEEVAEMNMEKLDARRNRT